MKKKGPGFQPNGRLRLQDAVRCRRVDSIPPPIIRRVPYGTTLATLDRFTLATIDTPYRPVRHKPAPSGETRSASPARREHDGIVCTCRQSGDPLRPAALAAVAVVAFQTIFPSAPGIRCSFSFEIDQPSYVPGRHSGQKGKRSSAMPHKK